MLRRSLLRGAGSVGLVGILAGCGSEQGRSDSDSTGKGDEGEKAEATKEPTSGNGLDEEDKELPAEAPPVDEWTDLGGIGVPASSSYGPAEKDGALWTGYAHSPKGAVFAAPYVLAGPSQTDINKFIEQWMLPGERTEELRAEATGEGNSPSTDASDGGADEADDGTQVRVLGFRIQSYSDELARIDVAMQARLDSGTVGYMSVPVTLVWSEDRWRVDPATYDWDSSTLDSNLTGFTQW